MKAAAVLFAVLCVGCGGTSTPATPTPTPVVAPPPPSGPTTYTISGTVTATNGGAPLSGAIAVFAQTTPFEAGRFTVQWQTFLTGSIPFVISGPNLLTRTTTIALANRTLNLDAIALSGGFDLNFYRSFVRNSYDAPTQLEPLRRWTQNPNVYLRTIDDAGTALDAKTLDVAEAAIREAVPAWTAGSLAAVIERGAGTKDGTVGWITIHWQSSHNLSTSDTAFCGNSDVGRSPGKINLTYAGVCRCPGSEIRPRTVRHEIGHAMGFWHTGNANDLMSGLSVDECDRQPSDRKSVV